MARLSSSQMDFNIWVRNCGIETSRTYFEDFCFDFLRIKEHLNLKPRNITKIQPNPGDDGIDILIGEISPNSDCEIWQCKFFLDTLEDTQKNNIRKSFNQAFKKSEIGVYNILKWVLVLPRDFTPEEQRWWEVWMKRKKREKKVVIEKFLKSDLLFYQNYSEFDNLFLNFFSIRNLNDLIEPIQMDYDLIDDEYEDFNFVKNIRLSDLRNPEISTFKEYYFQGQYFEESIKKKNIEQKINALKHIEDLICIYWNVVHKKKYLGFDGEDGQDVYDNLFFKLEENYSDFKGYLREIDLSYLIGLTQILSDNQKIYWSRLNPGDLDE